MKLLPFMSFVAVVALLAVLLLGKQEWRVPEQKPFPSLVLTSMTGKQQWQAENLQGKVTLINIFASWCTPCAAEMPELAALQKAFPAVAVEGIAWNDTPEKLKPWLKKNGNPFRQLWLDPKGDAAIALGLKGVPETVIVDGKGMIRYRVAGVITKAVREQEIEPLLTELTGKP